MPGNSSAGQKKKDQLGQQQCYDKQKRQQWISRSLHFIRKEFHSAWRQRHSPSINQKIHIRFLLLSEVCYVLTAMICEVPPGYRDELMEDKRQIEAGVDRSDLTETVREACARRVEVFNKKPAD